MDKTIRRMSASELQGKANLHPRAHAGTCRLRGDCMLLVEHALPYRAIKLAMRTARHLVRCHQLLIKITPLASNKGASWPSLAFTLCWLGSRNITRRFENLGVVPSLWLLPLLKKHNLSSIWSYNVIHGASSSFFKLGRSRVPYPRRLLARIQNYHVGEAVSF